MSLKANGSLVVGIDLTPYSKIVVAQARILSKVLGAKPVFVFAFEDVNHFAGVQTEESVMAKELDQKVRRYYRFGSADHVEVRFGAPSDQILEAAQSRKNPMIVIGHRGTGFLSRLFLGSVAEKLISTSKFPVWIQRGEKALSPKRLLVPTDLSPLVEKALGAVAALRGRDSKVEIHHVIEEPVPVLDFEAWAILKTEMEKAEARKASKFRRRHPELPITRSRGPIAQAILRRAKNFDAVILTPRRRGKATFGRVAGKIMRAGSAPVLILP